MAYGITILHAKLYPTRRRLMRRLVERRDYDAAFARSASFHQAFATSLFADKSREDIIGDRLNLALRQAGRVRIVGRVGAQLAGGAAVTGPVFIAILVEVRHLGSRAPAR